MAKKHMLINWFGSAKKVRVLWTAVFILAALQALSSVYILNLWEQDHRASRQLLSVYIGRVEESRYKHPVIDVTENRVYIPEARVYLPLNKISRDVRYDYAGKTLYLTLPGAIGRQINKDPIDCDKMVLLTQSIKAGPHYTLVSTIQSTDVSFHYVFKHKSCTIYPDSMSEDLAKIAKEIHSY
jgi:hypothetical protein